MDSQEKSGRLRVKEKLGYALGDYACDLYFMFFIYYVLFFYTDVFGIPPAVAGTMLFVTKLWDSINDPMMGIISDRTKTKWGKYRPYILWMFVPYGIIGVLTFTTPELSMTWKVVYAYVFYTLINMVYTAINIPYSALMGVMTSNSKERTSLSSYRFVAAYAGGVTVSGLTLVLAAVYGGGSMSVISARGLEDHKIELVEQGVGTVQVKSTFNAIEDVAAKEKAGWALEMQGVFKDLDHVEKTCTVWVKSRENLIDQLVYEPEGRKKALASLAEWHPDLDVAALEGLDREPLQAALLASLPESKPIELSIDGNFYLESGFGKKVIDGRALWDDTQETGDVWADSRKVNWKTPFDKLDVIDQQKGFQMTIGTFAVVAMMLFVVTFLTTRERVHPPKDQKTSVLMDLKIVATNRPWIVVAVMSLFTLAFSCIFGASIMYYFKYYIGIPLLAGAFQLVGTLTNLVGAMLTKQFSNLWGSKKKTYFIHSVIAAGVMACYFLPGRDDIAILFLLTALGGLATGPLNPIVWAMYADIADHSEWKTGIRATGLFYSAGTFSQKMGWTIGGAFTGWILAWYGFEANIAQTEETQTGIKMLMSFIPAACALVGGCLVLFYNLDDKLMVRIEKELQARRDKLEAKKS